MGRAIGNLKQDALLPAIALIFLGFIIPFRPVPLPGAPPQKPHWRGTLGTQPAPPHPSAATESLQAGYERQRAAGPLAWVVTAGRGLNGHHVGQHCRRGLVDLAFPPIWVLTETLGAQREVPIVGDSRLVRLHAQRGSSIRESATMIASFPQASQDFNRRFLKNLAPVP